MFRPLNPLDSLSRRFDRVGLALSGACLVHCLFLPLAAASLPILAGSVHEEWVHWLFAVVAIPVSVIALRHNHQSKPMNMALRAVAVLGIGFLFLGALGWNSHDFKAVMTVLGSLVLACVHLTNYFYGQRKATCN